MFKKSFFLSLVALLLTSALINPPVFADHHGEFKPFNLKDYQLPNNLTKEQVIRQIIEFSSKIQYEIDNCNGPDENKHKMYCTNIHEADRLRLAYLLNLNLQIPQEKINEKTLKRIVIKSVSFSVPGPVIIKIVRGDIDSVINQDPRIDVDNITAPFTAGINAPEYIFSHAVEYSLKTIALPDLKDRKISDARLKVANMSPEDLKNVTNEDILGISPINHSVLSLVLEMFQKKSNLDFFDEDKFKNWLAFNEKEAHYFALNDAEYDKIQNSKIDFEKYLNVDSGCVFRGFSALLLCAPTRFMAGTAQGAIDIMNKKSLFHLNVNMLNKSTTGKKDGHIKIVWIEFRNLANILLIAIFLLLTLAKISNYKQSEYNFKKLIPRLAVIAIILNLSFFAIQLSAEFSNVVGNGIGYILDSLADGSVDLVRLAREVLSGMSGIGIAIAAKFAPYIFIPLLIGALVAVFAVIIALAIRDAMFVILIILSPIAIVSLALPNTSNLYRIWLKMFSGVLLLFPTIALLFGSGNYIGSLMNKSDVFLIKLVAFVPVYLPFFFVPKIVFGLVGKMPIFGNKLNSMLSGASGNLTSRYKNSEDYKDRISDFKRRRQQKERQATGLDFKKDFGSIKSWRPFGKNRPSFLSIDNWVKSAKGFPGVVDKSFADFVAKPATDPELFKQLTDEALDFTKVDPIAAEHFIKSLDPSHPVSTASLSPQQLTQFNLFNSSYAQDPNKILIAMMAMSNLGKGNFDDIVNSTNQFLKLGGDESLLDSTMYTMMKNYKKESEFETSALLLETLKKAKSNYKTNFDTSTSPLDFVNKTSLNHKASRENIVFKSYAKTTDWKKFTGYANNPAAHTVFDRYMTSLSPDLKKKVLADIRRQTSSQDALDYIDQFD